MIAVITAHKEGKQIQCRTVIQVGEEAICKEWADLEHDKVVWNFGCCDYRVKPEPKYRPYKDIDECFAEVKKHGGWIRKGNSEYYQITSVEPKTMTFSGDFLYHDEIVHCFVWADDGTPCGVKEE